jgi:hypothetical protein
MASEPPAGARVAGAARRATSAARAAARRAKQIWSRCMPRPHVSETAPLSKDQTEALRAAGFAAAQVAPRSGIFRGQTRRDRTR